MLTTAATVRPPQLYNTVADKLSLWLSDQLLVVFSVLDHCETVSVVFWEKWRTKWDQLKMQVKFQALPFFSKKNPIHLIFQMGLCKIQEPLIIFRGPWFSGLISESFHCGPNIQKEVPSYYPAKEDSDLAPFWEIWAKWGLAIEIFQVIQCSFEICYFRIFDFRLYRRHSWIYFCFEFKTGYSSV